MNPLIPGDEVMARDGRHGVVRSIADGLVEVVFEDGEAVSLAPKTLDGPTRPSGAAGEADELTGNIAQNDGRASESSADTVAVAKEFLDVKKRRRSTGSVVAYITVHEREEQVDLPLVDEHVDVERVEVNRMVDAPPPVREEGDVTIVPVMEEVLVVEKRLRVKYELHLKRRRETRHDVHYVKLREEEARILRAEESPA